MRYDTAVYFQRITPGEYDETTGNYSDPVVTEDKRIASVTQSPTQPKGDRKLRIEHGSVREDSLTVRLLNPYPKPFDRIRIGGRLYSADTALRLRNKQTFVISEIQAVKGG
ncbi:MAG: hypothetical protein Q4A32_03580 [Lachnospiraceae bacterium]|nr:hypothetical protein [Lachnospiraceae bacterium]